MHLLTIFCSNVIVLIQCSIGKALAINVESRILLPNDHFYYDYEPARLQWHAVHRLCIQRSGSLAVVSSDDNNLSLTGFLQSLNISDPVWIAQRAPEISATPDLVLNFLGQNSLQSARLVHKFSKLADVTVCTRISFGPFCNGSFTVFSYSIHSFINEFQVRARIIPNERVQLALLVHGQHGPYVPAFDNDFIWHSVCVSWTGNGGKWVISADGQEVEQGSALYSSEEIGGDGIFIIGQEQDSFGGSFKSEEAFCGSITQFHVWDQVLNAVEIGNMEKNCLYLPSGLIYKWGTSKLEMTPTLGVYWSYVKCQELFHRTNNDSCMIYDPASGNWGWDNCESQRGGVCQFQKEPQNNFGLPPFPQTPLFTEITNGISSKPESEGNILASPTEQELIWLSSLADAAVKVLQNNPDMITSSDLQYLTQTIEVASAFPLNSTTVSSEVITSMATSYVNLASALVDPAMGVQWLELKLISIHLRPFMVIESIEKLLWALADAYFTDKKSFTLSTRNIDIHMEPRTLSPVSCSCAYKPSSQAGQSQDEILIPETEIQRLHSLGHTDVMFIHAYYSQLLDLLSKTKIETSTEPQTKNMHSTVGHLASAVISATVRDVLRAENVPVSVQYTLTTLTKVEYSKHVTPVPKCIFWDVNNEVSNGSDWSGKGCKVLYSGSNATSCFCNHTTNFAVLMNYLENKWSEAEESILNKLTFIGSGASLCALVVTLMLFTVLDIPKSDRTSVHKNLFISLTFAQIVLLCSGSAVNNKVACTVVAALLHLFFMAAFSWMLVEGLMLWSKVVAVNLNEDRHMKYYYLIGWGLPVLIVTITLASATGKYSADGHCWLSVQNGVIWGFAGPVIFIVVVNIMVLTRVLVITISTAKRRTLMMAPRLSPMERVYEQIRAAVKAVLVLLPILGLTWLCGVLVPFSIIIAYIFILLNSLQGLFIFLIYGVYNTEVRSTVNRMKERRKAQNFLNCGSSKPSSSINNFQPGSTPVPGILDGYGFSANQSGNLSISSACTSLSCSSGRQFSVPCVNSALTEDLSCPPNSTHIPTEDHDASGVDGAADSCSLHVPMDSESTSCSTVTPTTEQHSSKDLN
ncbi:adhesion G-protein coupled receptor D2 [Trichomycterus rosablanca]|uniref:adhesion G-protein coupled receptor D2 n=1 Tax=Trichomycterus rosablanca TaxID=2290929 RepID=UPI002F3550E2